MLSRDKGIGLSKRGIQESNFTFSKDRTGKFVTHKTRMPTVKCVCGFEILVVPDLKAMDRAIKNHCSRTQESNWGSKKSDRILD